MPIAESENPNLGGRVGHADLVPVLLPGRRTGAQALLFACGLLTIQSCATRTDDVNALGHGRATLSNSRDVGTVA